MRNGGVAFSHIGNKIDGNKMCKEIKMNRTTNCDENR